MKLRTALKIRKAVGGPREMCYSDRQKTAALDRYERTKSAKADKAFFYALMTGFGAEGRAELFRRWGDPAEALRILMGAPEGRWKGDWSEFEKLVGRKATP
jgi:hypothetical protein